MQALQDPGTGMTKNETINYLGTTAKWRTESAAKAAPSADETAEHAGVAPTTIDSLVEERMQAWRQ
eukprot:6782689-Heterocapsa_arctica.AAC.1